MKLKGGSKRIEDNGNLSVSVYLGTSIDKHQIMPQKAKHIRTAFFCS